MSESSLDTGIDASLVPHLGTGDYQKELLQLDDDSLQTLRESLAKPPPAPPVTQPPLSLDDTRKRLREPESGKFIS